MAYSPAHEPPATPEPRFLDAHSTSYTACSTEFCPVEGWRDWVVCGTYQLVKHIGGAAGREKGEKEEEDEGGGDGEGEDTREGSLLLYRLVVEAADEADEKEMKKPCRRRLVHVQTVEVGAGVLDCKWRPPSSSSSPPCSSSSSFMSSPILACALSTGETSIYALRSYLSNRGDEEVDGEVQNETEYNCDFINDLSPNQDAVRVCRLVPLSRSSSSGSNAPPSTPLFTSSFFSAASPPPSPPSSSSSSSSSSASSVSSTAPSSFMSLSLDWSHPPLDYQQDNVEQVEEDRSGGPQTQPAILEKDEPPPSTAQTHRQYHRLQNQHWQRIVSSQCKGSLAVHSLHPHTGELTLLSTWCAHSLYSQPIEVWVAVFADEEEEGREGEREGGEVIWSGGDDSCLKGWDLRAGVKRPVWYDSTTHGAGVTCIARQGGKNGGLFATGCYDGVLRLWDVRAMDRRPLCVQECGEVGGGIWRIKWHPTKKGTMAVAGMHGGACVLELEEDERREGGGGGGGGKLRKRWGHGKHESMVYGIDWWRGGEGWREDIVASCSFYDRALHLWEC